MRLPMSLRLQMYLTSHPRTANRLLGLMGSQRLEATGRKNAIQAAQRAYDRVPFYRAHFERHGFTAERMRHLTWEEFQQLPAINKDDTEGIPEEDLLDSTTPSPRGDALIGRSSGTTRAPIHWPLGWSEFYITRSAFEAAIRTLGTHDGVPTAVVVTNAVEGGDQSGNMPYRGFFSMKEQYGWNMEVVATGEDSTTIHTWLRWFARRGYTSLYLVPFPGTMERLLDHIASLPEEERVDWKAFTRKHILMGGQLVARSIRERMRREMDLDHASLTSEEVIYVSSDTGQLMAHSTPFTIWLERFLEQHPAVYTALGLAEEHREKPIVEFIPPLSIQFEFGRPEGLTLTIWKHRPLIRYKIGDLVWARRIPALVEILNRVAPSWRQDFQKAGGHRLDIPKTATIGVVLGRADEIAIVNAANISPFMVRQALEAAGILPQIHHFKHTADPAHPNDYFLYLELNDRQDEHARQALTDAWHTPILDALLQVPAATDLVAAHRTNPIIFHLAVRSRGEDEFDGDDGRGKKTHAVRRSV